MSPARRICGPGTSPDSTRRRRARELRGSEPRSQTVVKPQLVSISHMWFRSAAAGALAALFQAGSVRWTWLFQKPATMVFPAQSMTRVPFGILTSERLPTAVMIPPEVRTTASLKGAAVGEEYTVAPTKARACGPAASAGNAVKKTTTSKPRAEAHRRITGRIIEDLSGEIRLYYGVTLRITLKDNG